MAQPRVRQDVWKLSKKDPWDTTILWYAKAIANLKLRDPNNDPTGWVYQAAIHDISQDSNPQPQFWAQCQHFSWFFLPWHRMYLFYFEQIIKATIATLGSQKEADDWNLPYWNYSDPANPDATKLPPAFYALTMPGPGNVPNPLRVEDRARGNDGRSIAGPRQTDVRTCLREPEFPADLHGGSPGFGGPITGFNHDSGKVGALEGTPHGTMHNAVGGWMSNFATAALDPIFWLHHCNIDRLWNVWLKRDVQHKNPQQAAWMTNQKFEFHDADKNVVFMTSSQVAISTTAPLSYEYEDESDPLGGRAAVATSGRLAMTDNSIPEMVGATTKPTILTGSSATTSFATSQPTGPGRLSAPIEGVLPRIYLNLENIKGPRHPTSYSVYVNLPPGGDPNQHPELYAGNMPLFGVAEASRSDEKHPGSGLHYAFEIGDVVRILREKGDWDPQDIRVTFVPDYEVAARTSESATPAIQVGRISLYHK
jgi:tyrosinase